MKRLLLIALLLTSTGCIISKHPLTDPKKAKPDPSAYGTWKAPKGQARIVVEKIDDALVKQGIPKGFMRVTMVSTDSNGKENKEVYYVFSSRVGKDTYANAFKTVEQVRQHLSDKAPQQHAVALVKYSVNKDRLILEVPDYDKLTGDVRAKVLKGTIGKYTLTVTEEPTKLRQYLLKNREKFFAKKITYTRVK